MTNMPDILPVPVQDQKADDEAAIASTIEAETQAFVDIDFDAWAACWAHTEHAKMIAVTATAGLVVQSGWAEISADMKQVMENGLTCDMGRFENSNYHIQIDRDVAWVTYDQWSEGHTGDANTTFETRILERHPNGWKIVYCAFIDHRRDTLGKNVVSVDASGTLLWASPKTLDILKTHPILTVSAGRIRARRTDWDKPLQTAIAKAGRYHGFFEHQRFEDEAGGPFRYPAVLGETDEGGIAVVLVSVRDGTTYIEIDGSKSLDRRLAVAQAVFGLSDGQRRVAHLIAEGHGPKGAAETLGISINTARTHLTRLYEKTGVNSQASLVRLLLSVG